MINNRICQENKKEIIDQKGLRKRSYTSLMKGKKSGWILIFLVLFILQCICIIKNNPRSDANSPQGLLWRYRSKKKASSEEVKNKMKNHLKEKYGNIEYEILNLTMAGYYHDYDLLQVYRTVDGKRAELFRVERHEEKGGSYRIEDSYFGLLIGEEYEKMIKTAANQYFADCKVYTSITHNFSNTFTKDSTLKDAIDSHEIDGCTIVVAVDEIFQNIDEFNSAAEGFIARWKEKDIKCAFRIIYLEHEVFAETNRESRSHILSSDNNITEYYELIK